MTLLTIDRASGLPIYLQIKHQIIYEMALDRLAPGTALPSIRRLAESLNVTTATIRHAYDALEADGLVVSYPGKGVLVAELSVDARAQVTLRQAALVGLLTPELKRARALGYSTEEIRIALWRAVEAQDNPRVVFVGAEPEFVDRYAPLLTEALRDVKAEVVGVLMRDFRERAASAFHELGPPHCVATLVRSYAQVRDLMKGTSIPVLGLALELAAETQTELLTLPNSARAALVAERMNLTGMAHLIERYWLPEHPLEHVALEGRGLETALRSVELIIHSSRARKTVARLTLPGRRAIELHFVFNPVSLDRLRAVIGGLQAEARGSEAVAIPA